MTCSIITPDKTREFSSINVVYLPSANGIIGIMPGHEALITHLKAGEVRVKSDGETHAYAISGGFADVKPDSLKILVQTAEHSGEIDVMQAEEAKKEAERLMAEAEEDVHFGDAEALLERNIARLKVAERHQKHHVPGQHHRKDHPPSTY